jgi:DNA repair protein RecO (recombination protein O)
VLEHRTRGLVLRTFDQGESDRLVHLYTERIGRVSAIAKGARRSKRRFPGTLELFSVLELRLVEPPRASLMRIEGATLARAFEGIAADLGRYAVACELVEILDRFTGEREAQPETYRFAEGVLAVVDGETPDRLLGLLVVAKTLARLGYRPQLARCAGCGREVPERGRIAFAPREGGALCASCARDDDPRAPAALLRALEAGIRTPLRERAGLGLEGRRVAEAESLLDRFFRFHVGFELRSAPFARRVLPLERLDAPGSRGDTAPAPPQRGERRTASPHERRP